MLKATKLVRLSLRKFKTYRENLFNLNECLFRTIKDSFSVDNVFTLNLLRHLDSENLDGYNLHAFSVTCTIFFFFYKNLNLFKVTLNCKMRI